VSSASDASAAPVERVAVVGAGLIGSGWAALFSAHGLPVAVFETNPAARPDFDRRVERAKADLVKLGLTGDGQVRWCAALAEAVRDADLIQENVSESAPVKQKLFREIQEVAAPAAIIASSTTALMWSEISAGAVAPERIVVAHPFNPVHLIPLVELYGPDPAIVERAARFYVAIGKTPARLKREARGHLANRLAAALYREAVHIVAEGIADVAEVDKALVDGPGLRWSVLGAHMTYHLGGGSGGIERYLDHLGPSQVERWRSLGTPALSAEVKRAIVDGVAAEAGGRSIADLEAERDAKLVEMLIARRARPAE
jgi:3-hydroxyacyl-CoA dehydrogenase